VVNVNIANVRGKKKRQGRYEGMTRRRRKALIALSADSKEIKIFADEDNDKK
ncbi:MAG: 50S ribosomal protein L23, partial [Lacticaseibacillus paracasei]